MLYHPRYAVPKAKRDAIPNDPAPKVEQDVIPSDLITDTQAYLQLRVSKDASFLAIGGVLGIILPSLHTHD